MEDSQVLDTIRKHVTESIEDREEEANGHTLAVRRVIDQLVQIRNTNHLDDQTLGSLAEIGGETYSSSGGDYIISPKGITMTPIIRQAFRSTFQGISQKEGVSDEARETLMKMAFAMMNVEELLGTLFAGFYTGHKGYQKQYLFVAWLFWAYLRVKMEESAQSGENGLYKHLASFPENHRFITLNYTEKFFPDPVKERVHFFHGDCMTYIRLDTRNLIRNDQNALKATSPEKIAAFIGSLDMDIATGRVFLPGIVPPLSVKPVICREHLETWYHCGQLIDQATTIVVTGYSFNLADEHLNDLLRKRHGPLDTKIVVINPDIEGTATNVCKLLGKVPEQLNKITIAGCECWQAQDLTFVNAKAEELSSDNLGLFMEEER